MLCDFRAIKRFYIIKKFCRVKAVKLKLYGGRFSAGGRSGNQGANF
jgi:hypothetical protein